MEAVAEPGGPPPGFCQPEWLFNDKGNPEQRAEICANICLNSYLDVQPFRIQDHSDQSLVLCGGGPSLKDNLDLIRWHQSKGSKVVCTNDTHVYLREHGIEPFCWAYGEVQHMPEDHRWFREKTDVPLYIPSHCDHRVVKRLMDENTVMWHCATFDLANTLIGTFYPGEPAFWGSGIPLLRFMTVCIAGWGHKDIHLFGVDSSYRDDKSHAYYEMKRGEKKNTIPIWVAGRDFQSTPALIRQANDFQRIVRVYSEKRPDVKFTVYGDGLLPWASNPNQH